MTLEQSNVWTIYNAVSSRLESFSRRVSEGRDLDNASEFARWLNWSGILELLKANPQPAPLFVDGALLQWRVDQLISQCNERFLTGKNDPSFSEKDFQSIHEKIDLMAGYLSRLSVAPAVSVARLLRDEDEFGQVRDVVGRGARSERCRGERQGTVIG